MANESLGACVLDANTLISAFLFPDSMPGLVLSRVLSQGRLLMSYDIAGELAEVLRRSKFDRYLSAERREELLASTINSSEMVEVVSVVQACRDPDDNKYLELAVDGKAKTIVTGDGDLLTLHPFQGIDIVPPRDFVTQHDLNK